MKGRENKPKMPRYSEKKKIINLLINNTVDEIQLMQDFEKGSE